MSDLELLLAQQPFLKGMDAKFLKTLEESASLCDFKPGKFIFRQNQDAMGFYLILEGKVDVEWFSSAGGPVVVQSLGAGEVLGWSWLVPPFHWRMDARALQSCRLILFDGKTLLKRMEENHDLGYELLKRFLFIVTQRLDAARLEILSLHGTHT